MGKKIHTDKGEIDIECQPEVIARRTALFNKYILPLSKMIFKLCKDYSWNKSNVEENYTDAMVNLYRRIETYDPNRPIHAWVHVCVKRQVWFSERHRQAHNNKTDDHDIEWYQDELLNDEHTSVNVFGVENWRDCYNADIVEVLDELEPRCREAFILHEAGYSLKEIVKIEYGRGALNTPSVDTIKSRLKIARKHLRKNINKDGQRISGQANNTDIL